MAGIVGSWVRYLFGAAVDRPRRAPTGGGSPRRPLAEAAAPRGQALAAALWITSRICAACGSRLSL